MKNRNWPSFILRAFALTNFLIAGLGFLSLGVSLLSVTAGVNANRPDEPYFMPVFSAMIAVNYCFLGSLAFGSVRVLQLKPLGVAVCNAVFVGEILYLTSISILWDSIFSTNFSNSVAAATGVGNVGLGLQLI